MQFFDRNCSIFMLKMIERELGEMGLSVFRKYHRDMLFLIKYSDGFIDWDVCRRFG